MRKSRNVIVMLATLAGCGSPPPPPAPLACNDVKAALVEGMTLNQYRAAISRWDDYPAPMAAESEKLCLLTSQATSQGLTGGSNFSFQIRGTIFVHAKGNVGRDLQCHLTDIVVTGCAQ